MSRAEEPRSPRRPKPKPDPTEIDAELPPLPRPGPKPRSTPRLPPSEVPETEEASTLPEGSTFRPSTKKAKVPAGRPGATLREPKSVVGKPGLFERIIFGKVGASHLATFCRQFGAYLDAGVDLLKSLDSLQKQFSRSGLGPVLGRMSLAIRRGDSLSEAVEREPQAFDSQFVSMMKVAEARGGVPETLKRMASHYEARYRMIRQAQSALIYPVIVLVIAFAVGILLTVYILPLLVGILQEMSRGKSVDLPLPAKILTAFNTFMVKMGWWFVPLGLVGGGFGLIWAYRTPKGKAILDEIALYMPVLGKLLKKMDTSRFARTLSALLEAGVEIGGSLDLTAEVVRLTPFRRAVRNARSAVMEGAELSEALEASGRFSPDVIAIINSGEETGKLPESLERMADDYEEQVEMMIKNLSSLLQPVLIVFLGGIVLLIILAFISTYLALLTGLM